ncbi:MAG: hypothetical protein K8F57_05485, partial [Alphaproteobacteria bacterium]|nr:hypothetical protein [Alphaproteobacteria bacterium]
MSLLAAVVLGAALVWSASPRLLSGLYLSTAREAAAPDAAKAFDALVRAERALRVAVAVHETGRDWVRLGGVRLALAEAAGFDTARGQALAARA